MIHLILKKTKILSGVLFPTIFFLFFYSAYSQEYSIEDIQKRVEDIGKLRFIKDVPFRILDKKELESYLNLYFSNEYPDKLADLEQKFLKYFGFTDSYINLKELRKSILLKNVAGFYDERPDSKTLFAVSSSEKINYLTSLVLVHELRHAIQDQYFNLNKLIPPVSDFDDRKFAILAALEGDATFLMVSYAGLDPSIMSSFSESSNFIEVASNLSSIELKNAPLVLKKQLLMPYLEGLNFINYIYKKGGWEKINKIFSKPPTSSEEIIHPEKYLNNDEKPKNFNLNDKKIPGLKKIYSGVIGEFYIQTLLEKTLERSISRNAAEGWNGDFYSIFENDKKYLVVWKSSWDSEKDADEFFLSIKEFSIKDNTGSVILNENGSLLIKSDSGKPEIIYVYLKKDNNDVEFLKSNDKIIIERYMK
ncbi:MAG: hypothetical protein AB1410_09155 [Acidobacteriota bacterium]